MYIKKGSNGVENVQGIKIEFLKDYCPYFAIIKRRKSIIGYIQVF